ncbi:MAG: hypothetical protein GY880_24230 [Planctomycetaceae bacterium]|nr:hypothetical protein [Planctomycetaceae bacterium]MDC0311314.1 hypothetical protein [bacterium]
MTLESNGVVHLREFASGKVGETAGETINERVNKGTAMLAGLTNSLTRNNSAIVFLVSGFWIPGMIRLHGEVHE